MARHRLLLTAVAAALVVCSGLVGAAGAGASTAPAFVGGVPGFTVSSLPVPAGAAVPSAPSLPTWTGSFSFGGTTYGYRMVGTNPTAGSARTTVASAILPLKFVIGGHAVDATTAASSLAGSPIFQAAAFQSGTSQFGDAMQRAEFWSTVSAVSRNYHVVLGRPSILPTVTVTVPANQGTYTGHGKSTAYALVGYEWFLSQLPGILRAQNLPAATLPVVLSGNVFLYQNGNQANCCVYGMHGTYAAVAGTATYAYANYLSYGLVPGGLADIYTASHEVAEWLNDPFVNNAVPRWVQPGSNVCFSSLMEVADAVQGLPNPAYVLHVKQTVWHPTDVAGISWFAHLSPSAGQNHEYSYHHLLTAPSTLC